MIDEKQIMYEHLLCKVEAMRNAQIEYFRTRSRDWLGESKRLEKEVDKTIQEIKEAQLKLEL